MKINSFNKVQEKLLGLVSKFSDLNEGKVFYGDWTIKEVVAHISAWNLYFSAVFQSLSNKAPLYGYWGNINEFNRIEVAKRKNKSFQELKSELKKSGDKFAKQYEVLNPRLIGTKIWPDKKYTPQDLLKIEVDHYESQIRQIEKRI